MTFADPIVEAGAVGLADLFRKGAADPVAATEVYLARIARLNSAINAVLDLDIEGARAAAKASAERWARGAPLSPVDGVPIAVKANIAVAGLPWHAGIGAYRDRIADTDAEAVARLRSAGAVILGTLNMHEAALGATTDNVTFGRCHNPHRIGFTPGGSSGGSGAAVAAGLCAAALGSDTMGSVRIPSAYCGVFGHKPTQHLISDEGVVPLSWSLDHVGVHARSAADCAAVTAAASGAVVSPATGQRLAVLDFAGQIEVEPAVAAAFSDLVERALAEGFVLETVRLDLDFGALRRAGLLVCEAEGFVVHQKRLAEDPEGFTPELRKLLNWGAEQPAWKLAKAQATLFEAAAKILDGLAGYAGLLMPTAPQVAFAFGAPIPAGQADFTALADFTGLPACAFPLGISPEGLPLSAQVMAWTDDVALGVAQRLASVVGAPAEFRA